MSKILEIVSFDGDRKVPKVEFSFFGCEFNCAVLKAEAAIPLEF
jgi:hypothetical protein